MNIEIVKSHGTSNDFVMIEDIEDAIDLPDVLVERICDRRRGIGADGVIRVVQGSAGRMFMDHRNADGSRPEMCGNGIRCFAKFCFDRGILTGAEATVETRSGPKAVFVHRDATERVCRVEVDMGPATFAPQKVPVEAPPGDDHLTVTLDGAEHDVWFVGMGNPHAVLFVDDPGTVPVEHWGPAVERDARFPNGVNVSFATVVDPATIRARVWERGVGETMACGTGACAVAAAASRRGLAGRSVDIHLPGGELHISLDESVLLAGPAAEVFTATVDTRSLGA